MQNTQEHGLHFFFGQLFPSLCGLVRPPVWLLFPELSFVRVFFVLDCGAWILQHSKVLHDHLCSCNTSMGIDLLARLPAKIILTDFQTILIHSLPVCFV